MDQYWISSALSRFCRVKLENCKFWANFIGTHNAMWATGELSVGWAAFITGLICNRVERLVYYDPTVAILQ